MSDNIEKRLEEEFLEQFPLYLHSCDWVSANKTTLLEHGHLAWPIVKVGDKIRHTRTISFTKENQRL